MKQALNAMMVSSTASKSSIVRRETTVEKITKFYEALETGVGEQVTELFCLCVVMVIECYQWLHVLLSFINYTEVWVIFHVDKIIFSPHICENLIWCQFI